MGAVVAGNIGLNLALDERQFLQQMASLQRTAQQAGEEIAEALSETISNIDLSDIRDQFVELGDDIEEGLQGAEGGIDSLTESLGGLAAAVAGAFAVDQIVDFTGEALEAASEMNAVESQFSQVFGNLESTANNSLQQISDDTGILTERMQSSYAQIAAFAKTTGMDTAEALDLANRSMVAIADSAAYYDRSLEDVTESLQSFLKGNFENDAALGLSCTETTRNAAANRLYGQSFVNLSEQQKQLTLLSMVEEANQLSGAMGQAARESDTWTNQTGNLAQAFTNLQATIGNFLLPIALQAVKCITSVVNTINILLSKLYAVAQASTLFENASIGSSNAISNEAQSVENTSTALTNATSNYNGASTGATKLAKASTNATKATKSMSKAAKKLKKDLLGFDAITKLSDPEKNNASKSPSAKSPSGGTNTSTPSISTGGIPSTIEAPKVETPKETAKLPFDFSNLEKSVTRLQKSFGAFANVIKNGIGWVFENILVPLGKWTIEKAAPKLLDLLSAAFDVLTATLEALQPLWQWVWDNFLSKIAKFAGDTIIKFLDVLITGLESLAGWISKHQTAVQNITIALLSFFSAFKMVTFVTKFIGPISNALTGIKLFGKGIISFKTLFSGLFPKLFSKASKALGFFTSPVGIAVVAIGALIAIGVLLWKNWDKIKKKLAPLIKAFKGFASSVKKSFKDIPKFFKGKFEEAKKKVTDAFNSIGDWFQENVVDNILGVVDGIKEIAISVGGKVEDTFDAAKEAWNSIQDRTVTLVGEAKEAVSGGINALKDKWESIKSGTRSLVAKAAEASKGMIAELKKKWESIKSRGEALTAKLKGVAQNTLAAFRGKWDAIKSHARDLVAKLKGTAQSTLTAFKNKWEAIKTRTRNLTAKMKGVAQSKLDSFRKSWEGIKSKTANLVAKFTDFFSKPIKAAWNAVARGINGAISTINNLPGVNIGKVPYLAQGGFVKKNTPRLAVIGDNRHQGEIVAPENKMLDMARQAAAMSGGNNNPQVVALLSQILTVLSNQDNSVYLDGKEITKNTVNRINKQTKSTGKCPIIV